MINLKMTYFEVTFIKIKNKLIYLSNENDKCIFDETHV
jgi:hypothetical protein